MKQNSIREGKLYIWNGMILFLGTVIDTALHRHHAVQITIRLSGEFILETEGGSFSSPAVIIDSDRSHRLRGESGVQALLLLAAGDDQAFALPAVHQCHQQAGARDA